MIGAGVVGVASAHALAERGHDVHVYDRRPEIASDTSASTAGLIAPGHSYAWASPTAPRMLLRSLLGADTSIKVRPRADADLIRWGLRFLRECTPSRSRANTLAKLELARYSQRLTDELAHRRDSSSVTPAVECSTSTAMSPISALLSVIRCCCEKMAEIKKFSIPIKSPQSSPH